MRASCDRAVGKVAFRRVAAIVLLSLCVPLFGALIASAQTLPPPNAPTLPMMQVGTAALISPTQAATYYGHDLDRRACGDHRHCDADTARDHRTVPCAQG